MKGKLALFLAITMLAVLLASCAGPPDTPALALNDMEMELADTGRIEVHGFRLADGEVFTVNDRPVAAPISGIIAVPPSEGPHPLVVLIHGGAPSANLNIHHRNYAGFDYLVQQLAAEGYVAVSINVNINNAFTIGEFIGENTWAVASFDYHIVGLAQANAGQDVGHGIDLTDMIDLNQIHLIGHSRGAEIAETLVRREKTLGQNRFQSILRIAPMVNTYFVDEEDAHSDDSFDAPRLPRTDLPFGIILPEFDGDVGDLDGQLVFDEVFYHAENQSFGSLVLLRGANHNFFNRMFEDDDRYWERSRADREDRSTWLDRAQHEDFIKRYAAAFLSMVTQSRAPWGTFDPSEPQPVTMFGFPVTASSYVSGHRRVIAPPVENFGNATAAGAANISYYVQSFPARATPPNLFTHPAALKRQGARLPLYALRWDGRRGAVSFPVLVNDWSPHSALSLYVAVDSSHALHNRQDQSFTVVLTDHAGNEQHVLIPAGTSALTHHVGQIGRPDSNNRDSDYWWGHMPLGELRIPLSYFDEIDLADVSSLIIRFDQTRTGAVMLSGAYLV